MNYAEIRENAETLLEIFGDPEIVESMASEVLTDALLSTLGTIIELLDEAEDQALAALIPEVDAIEAGTSVSLDDVDWDEDSRGGRDEFLRGDR